MSVRGAAWKRGRLEKRDWKDNGRKIDCIPDVCLVYPLDPRPTGISSSVRPSSTILPLATPPLEASKRDKRLHLGRLEQLLEAHFQTVPFLRLSLSSTHFWSARPAPAARTDTSRSPAALPSAVAAPLGRNLVG
jgi:hypothetical protein